MIKIQKKYFGLGFSQKETVNFSLTGSLILGSYTWVFTVLYFTITVISGGNYFRAMVY